jgi:hypothetical protein
MNPFYIFLAILAVVVLLYLTGSIKFSATYTSSPPENYEEDRPQILFEKCWNGNRDACEELREVNL